MPIPLLDFFHHTPYTPTMTTPFQVDALEAPRGLKIYGSPDAKDCYFSVGKDKGLVLQTEAPKKPEDGSIFFDPKTKTLQVFVDNKPVIFKAASTATPAPAPEPTAPVSDKPATKAAAKAAGKAAGKATAKHKPKKLDVVAEPIQEEDDTSLQMDISEEEEEDEEDGEL